MVKLKRWWIGLVLLGLLWSVAATAPLRMNVSAQSAELLQDPGFEGPYVNRGRSTLNTPSAWQLWIQDGPHGEDWQNRADKVTAFPHNNGPEVHSGAHSLNLDGAFVTFTAAVYQQVAVQPGTNLTGSIWARLHTCDLPQGGGTCGSAVELGAYVKLGIDPNGGNDPNSGAVVWSSNIMPHDTYQQAVVSATAVAGTVTLFAYVTQRWPSDLNKVWFDDASLTAGGAGGAAPGQPAAAPPPAPIPQAFVAAVQPPRADGSIIHVVQPGDTLTGISTAYNVSIDTIMQLNGLRSSRYIFVGEELLIKPASGAGGNPDNLFSQDDLNSLNTTPGPTPVFMEITAAPPTQVPVAPQPNNNLGQQSQGVVPSNNSAPPTAAPPQQVPAGAAATATPPPNVAPTATAGF